MLDLEILCGENVVWWKNVLYLWGRRSNAFIKIMLNVALSNGYEINFIFILSYHPHMGRGNCGAMYG